MKNAMARERTVLNHAATARVPVILKKLSERPLDYSSRLDPALTVTAWENCRRIPVKIAEEKD